MQQIRWDLIALTCRTDYTKLKGDGSSQPYSKATLKSQCQPSAEVRNHHKETEVGHDDPWQMSSYAA